MVKIVICGGGIIGCTLAYYLSLRDGVEIVLIEQVDIASGASGKAGGFLASDWLDGKDGPGPSGFLARKSFDLHAELAEKFGEQYMYRRLQTLSIDIKGSPKSSISKLDSMPEWLDQRISKCSILGTEKTTAQVHPELFTKTMWREAQSKGAELIKGKVSSLEYEGTAVKSVVLKDGQKITGDVFVIAMGAWSKLAYDWIPKESKGTTRLDLIQALKANSIILRPKIPQMITPHAIFLNFWRLPLDYNPEIYPRSNGDVYICGNSSYVDLPESTHDVVCDDSNCIKNLTDTAIALSSVFKDCDLILSQACILPEPSGAPIIGRIPNVKNLFVATGHYCWGILNSTGTGLGLSELILDGKCKSIDLSHFDPSCMK
jgi:glycine/D-amino acid oxidase-like deaminating enzyme